MLSPHFDVTEFGAVPEECIPIFTRLCLEILEPVRAFVGKPIRITSGYRSPDSNAAAHGVTNSEHIATPEYCAADFTFDTTFGLLMSVRRVFDWMRENSSLPFHQVILEHSATGTSIIHVSINSTKTDREALEGATHNASAYQAWEVVAYNPSSTGQENA